MKKSIRQEIEDSLADYLDSSRREWILMWPGQVVLACSQIFWTAEVSQVKLWAKICQIPQILS